MPVTLRRFVCALVAVLGLVAVSVGGAAAVSPTVRMAIVHVVHGCHTWSIGTKIFGPSHKLTLKRGTRLVIRVSCPMNFDFTQTSGPNLHLAPGRTFAGTTRTIVFRKTGLYKLKVKNVESSEEQGLATLGPDNTLALTVRVK